MATKILDKLFLLLSILAALVQLLFALSVNLAPQFRTISFLILAAAILYIISSRLAYSSEQTITREQATSTTTHNVVVSDPGKEAYNYFASRYGIGYRLIQVRWKIDNDGSAILERTIHIEAFSKIEELDTYLLIPERSEDRQIGFVTLESLSAERIVTLSDIKKEFGRLSAITTISPPLNNGEKINYRMEEELPRGLYAIGMTKEELSKRKDPLDYCGWNINRPTRKISLQVDFPQSFKPKIFGSEVRYASTSGFASVRRHYDEEKKFTPTLTLRTRSSDGDRIILNLDVDYPMLGLIYILNWHPIAIDEPTDSRQVYLATIRSLLNERFSEGELRTLATDLEIDYDNLPDQGKENKARELVSFLQRRNQLHKLAEIAKNQRPDIDWPTIPD